MSGFMWYSGWVLAFLNAGFGVLSVASGEMWGLMSLAIAAVIIGTLTAEGRR